MKHHKHLDYKDLEGPAKEQNYKNIEKWGIQDKQILLLAITEELGELTQAYLENEYNRGGSLSEEYSELYDIFSLFYAYWLRLEWQRFAKYNTQFENIDEFYIQSAYYQQFQGDYP